MKSGKYVTLSSGSPAWVAYIFLVLFLALPVQADQLNCRNDGLPEAKGRSLDPKQLAAYWIKPIKQLSTVIPTLSPQEKRWLDEELSKDERSRTLWALDSREYSVRMARLDMHNLLTSLRRLNELDKLPDGESPERQWQRFVYDLIDYDGPLYLAKLVTDDVIEQKQIPRDWSWLTGIASDFTLQESIRANRLVLAQHILSCILPQFGN